MSAFSGKQFKGAMKFRREEKRQQAAERNSKTPVERTRNFRRHWSGGALVSVAR